MMFTIVSHNAYWFQGCPSLWGNEQAHAYPAVVAALAALYRELETDVVCVQEVPDAATAQELAHELAARAEYCAGRVLVDYGGAILVRRHDARFRDLTRQPGQSGPTHERVCLEATVVLPDGRDLRVVNLHLPSNRFDPAPRAAERRREELVALVSRRARPHIVAGDMNSLPGHEVTALLHDAGYVDAAEVAGLGDVPTAGQRRIDYVWACQELARTMVSYEVIADERFAMPEGGRLSDHCPVRVVFSLD